MSILRDDLEQKSPLDLDPLVGLHRPSPDSPLASEEHKKLGEIEQLSHEESGRWKEDLCHAICVNNWSDAKEISKQYPNALTAEIARGGITALHVAAAIGRVGIVVELLKLLDPQFHLTPDSAGFTALLWACWYNGNTQVAKCLVEKNSQLLVIPNDNDVLPVTMAFGSASNEMGRYLYPITPLECLTGRRGSTLVRCCFRAQQFDIALDLLQRSQELLLVPFNNEGDTPIHEIATLNTAVISPCEFIFRKRWINDSNVCVDIQQEDRSEGDKEKLTEPGHDLQQRLITSTNDFLGVKKIQDLKVLHAQVDELLCLVCKNARKAYQEDVIDGALRLAAKEGNAQFVIEVSKAIPEIFLTQKMLFCFDQAIDFRQARVFNLIHGLQFRRGLLTSIVGDGNILMHKAAKKAPDHVLNRINVPTLQMQRELQWFKEVESLTPLCFRGFRNKDGMTAEELFRESHRELMKQGEEWIKATASSCLVVGALIMTIMFAAAFTIPGGNDQNLGYPLFIKQSFFKLFIFSTVLSLLSSSTSVLMFLAILTTRYSEDKFLKSLPAQLILGLSFLFISIVSMMVAFLSTIRLMLKPANYSWGLLPIFILASVPVFFFVLSQFPLLRHTFVSTFGNTFDRNVKPWP